MMILNLQCLAQTAIWVDAAVTPPAPDELLADDGSQLLADDGSQLLAD